MTVSKLYEKLLYSKPNAGWKNSSAEKIEHEIVLGNDTGREITEAALMRLERMDDEKMSEDEWFILFMIENVRIDCVAGVEGYGSTTTTVYIDGELAEVVSDEYSYYSDAATELSGLDFTFNYDDFNHLGDGVYYAKSIVVSDDESEILLRAVGIRKDQLTLFVDLGVCDPNCTAKAARGHCK